jgi:polar amino acid transport system substrate-binding protein
MVGKPNVDKDVLPVAHRSFTVALLSALCSCGPACADDIAPAGTLRAVYLGSNPAQAVQDRATGAIRGVSADLARELGRRIGAPVEIKPVANPQAVLDAVAGGIADIGFVAYAPSRAGTVEFSQTYMLVVQSFLVLEGSSIRAIADIDRGGQKIAGTRDDSITLYLRRKLRAALLVETGNDPAEIRRMLGTRQIDAFGANRQRLTTLMNEAPGTRLLADNLFGVPQTIVVPKGRAEALTDVNRFIDDARASGFLQRAIATSGVIGIEPAPAGSWQPSLPD